MAHSGDGLLHVLFQQRRLHFLHGHQEDSALRDMHICDPFTAFPWLVR
jgi:hypothetical protein